MDLEAKIIKLLKQWPNKRIDLFTIQSKLSGDFEWKELEKIIGRLLSNKILVFQSKTVGLTASSKFRIDQTALYKEEWALIQRMELELDSRIHLDYYYKYPEEINGDKEVLLKIHHAIQEETIFEELYLPELSLRLVGDEKWLEYKEGRQFLKKIGLWEHFTVGNRYEPIAFALNPVLLGNVQIKSAETKIDADTRRGLPFYDTLSIKSEIPSTIDAELQNFGGAGIKLIDQRVDQIKDNQATDRIYCHLIVENKTTFKQIMNILAQTGFTTVIYGQGYKIISSCRMLKEQLPLKGKHQILYFGDFDKKGIEIFDALTRQIEVRLHQELYQALFKKTAVRGHENQNCAKEKIERFCSQFEGAKELIQLIENGSYLPQEMLSEEEMKKVLVRGQNDRL